MYYVIQADGWLPNFTPPKGCMVRSWDGASGVLIATGPFTQEDLEPMVLSVHDTMGTAELELAVNRGDI